MDELSAMTMTWCPQSQDLLMLTHRVLLAHEWTASVTPDGQFREYRNPYNTTILTTPVDPDDPNVGEYLGKVFEVMHNDDVAFHLYELSGQHLGRMLIVFLEDKAVDGTLIGVEHQLVNGSHVTTVTFADRTTETYSSTLVCMC